MVHAASLPSAVGVPFSGHTFPVARSAGLPSVVSTPFFRAHFPHCLHTVKKAYYPTAVQYIEKAEKDRTPIRYQWQARYLHGTVLKKHTGYGVIFLFFPRCTSPAALFPHALPLRSAAIFRHYVKKTAINRNSLPHNLYYVVKLSGLAKMRYSPSKRAALFEIFNVICCSF